MSIESARKPKGSINWKDSIRGVEVLSQLIRKGRVKRDDDIPSLLYEFHQTFDFFTIRLHYNLIFGSRFPDL